MPSDRIAESTNRQEQVHAAAGQPSAWLTSLLLHLAFLLVISLITRAVQSPPVSLLLTTDFAAEEVLQDDELPEEFEVEISTDVGSLSTDGSDSAESLAPEVGPITPEIPTTDLVPQDVGPIEYQPPADPPTALRIDSSDILNGAVGFGTTGAEGALDYITQEILWSMEERKTLVVWFFDQSGSLNRQRKKIHDRIDNIYEELGIVQQADSRKLVRASDGDAMLLSSVVSFGSQVTFQTKRPTDDVNQIKAAIRAIQEDPSGEERVFSAIQKAVTQFKSLRHPKSDPERNVLFVMFTDEAGNDQHLLDQTVTMCRNNAIPVHIVGAPAPFGRREAVVKWVDPNPEFDQSPRWGSVDQGPESYLQEFIDLGDDRLPPIDSGFGPYSLTRLAYQTSGSFFAVHPNRRTDRRVSRRATQPFSAHLEVFFDSDKMKKYAPDYVSQAEYMRRAKNNASRESLLEVANNPAYELPKLGQVRLEFVKRDEASLATALTESQKAAAKLTPAIDRLVETLKQGEKDREREIKLRWQAGYDLAYGLALAAKARTESYNLQLAKAKQGMKFKEPTNNTWVLRAASDLDAAGGQVLSTAKKARQLLTDVRQQHDGTPWAYVAARELRRPLVWTWQEKRTNLNPPRPRPNNPNNPNPNPRPPRDDTKSKLERPKKKRPVPKL